MLLRGAGVTVIIVGLMLYAVEGGRSSRQEIIHADAPEAIAAVNDTRGCPEYGSYAGYPQYESLVLIRPDYGHTYADDDTASP